MLRELADEAASLGIEYFCLDAGWFDGDFPHGVGNWTVNKVKFPHGLKPVADHVHGLGMKFGLWFEPERVGPETVWQKEYPELVLKGSLMDLSEPSVRALIISMMDDLISKVGVDWIRYDFNINPLDAWKEAEKEGKEGLKQCFYMNGLYEIWDELMKRHPNLLIEQCSSGGLRIDLESIRHGHTYWKSDDTFNQALMRFHETGGNLFLLGGHLNTNYCRFGSQGEVLALFAGPLGFGCDFRKLTVGQKESIRTAITAYREVRRFINEDYYPLFPQDKSGQAWNGWQFLCREAEEGFFVVYRPPGSPYPSATLRLQGLQESRSYVLRNVMTKEERRVPGAELLSGIEMALEPDAGQVFAFLSAPAT
jgi:alpha-galactosidase